LILSALDHIEEDGDDVARLEIEERALLLNVVLDRLRELFAPNSNLFDFAGHCVSPLRGSVAQPGCYNAPRKSAARGRVRWGG
jgi:hypothetical protein